jgi:hypothetical protein
MWDLLLAMASIDTQVQLQGMNIQRRNVSSERILILFSNTTYLFSVAVSKDFPQTILCHQI